ncbi:MAG: hypothetical protein EOO87_23915 [Pedobacter sp.]|nr:MAG: hypothetical protein EOO87_23915 [Pedobacter sp.]
MKITQNHQINFGLESVKEDMFVSEKHTSSNQSQIHQVLIVIEELIHAFRRSQAVSFEAPSTIKITFTGPNSDRSAVGKIVELLKNSIEINVTLTYQIYHRENLISYIVT